MNKESVCRICRTWYGKSLNCNFQWAMKCADCGWQTTVMAGDRMENNTARQVFPVFTQSALHAVSVLAMNIWQKMK